MERSAAPIVQVAVVAILSLGIYAETLRAGFVVDDMHQVLDNYLITDARHIPEILTTGVWDFDGRPSSYYRPLMHILYMGVYLAAGPQPWAFHLLNVLLNAACCAIVLLILVRLLRPDPAGPALARAAPLLGALLFAVHPAHSEAVAWVAAVTDLSFSFFFLLSLYLYMARGDPGPRLGLILSLGAFLLATLCKEPAVTLPVVIVAYDLLVARDAGRWADRLGRWAAYGAVIAVYLALRAYALGGFAPTADAAGLDARGYVLFALGLFSAYVGKILLPVSLNFWHTFAPPASLLSSQGLVALAVAAAFLAACWVALRRSRPALFALVLFAAPLAPSFYVSALNQGLVQAFTERYLYLPSLGAVALAAMGLSRAAATRPRWAPATALAALSVTGLFCAGTILRVPVWRDGYTLWSDAVSKSPGSAVAHQNYGNALIYRGREEEGKRHLAKARELDPLIANAVINKGIAYAGKGMTSQAILAFHEALAVDPGSALANYYLGVVYDDSGLPDLAAERYERAIALQPDLAEAHNGLGVALARGGDLDRALESFETAARLKPDDPSIRANLERAREAAPTAPGSR